MDRNERQTLYKRLNNLYEELGFCTLEHPTGRSYSITEDIIDDYEFNYELAVTGLDGYVETQIVVTLDRGTKEAAPHSLHDLRYGRINILEYTDSEDAAKEIEKAMIECIEKLEGLR